MQPLSRRESGFFGAPGIRKGWDGDAGMETPEWGCRDGNAGTKIPDWRKGVCPSAERQSLHALFRQGRSPFAQYRQIKQKIGPFGPFHDKMTELLV